MAEVRKCHIPEDLYYWVEKHVWVRPEPDGTVTVGLTDVAQSLAKTIISATPREVGRTLAKGRSAGTVESGKWVGPVPAPVSGQIVAVNERLRSDPSLINRDPYGEGWFVRLRPTDWEAEKGDLLTGEEAVAAYARLLEEQGIRCRE